MNKCNTGLQCKLPVNSGFSKGCLCSQVDLFMNHDKYELSVHNIVCLMWMPYHCDVPRNEITDNLVQQATCQEL